MHLKMRILKDVEGIGEKTATNIIDVTNREFKE